MPSKHDIVDGHTVDYVGQPILAAAAIQAALFAVRRLEFPSVRVQRFLWNRYFLMRPWASI
jgi:hypothetical protein